MVKYEHCDKCSTRLPKKPFHSLVYTVVEFGNAFVGPVFSELRQNVTQSIRPVGNTINTHINVTLHSAFHPISSQLPLNTQSDDNMFVLGDGPVYV